MQSSLENKLQRLQQSLQRDFPDTSLKFNTQIFPNHVELWVYVLTTGPYESVRTRCDQLSVEMDLDHNEPEIWLIPKIWTGAWPGGESEQKLRERRHDFMRKHGIPIKA